MIKKTTGLFLITFFILAAICINRELRATEGAYNSSKNCDHTNFYDTDKEQTTGQQITPTTSQKLMKKKKKPRMKIKLIVGTQVEAKGMLGAIGSTVPLKATLFKKLNKKPIHGQILTFHVSGKYVGFGITDKLGRAKMMYHVPNEIGSKPILVKYKGNKIYSPSKDTAKIGIIKSPTKMSLKTENPDLIRSGLVAHLKGTLYRSSDKKAVYGRQVEIEVQGSPVAKRATANNGTFQYTYSVPSSFTGNLKLGARFRGDKLYLATANNLTVKVLPAKKKAYIYLHNVSGMVGETKSVLVKASTSIPYRPIHGVSGLHMDVYRKKTESGRSSSLRLAEGYTNSKGLLKLKFKIEDKAGKYKFYSGRFGPRDEYDVNLLGSGKHRLHVSRSPVSIQINGPNKVRIGDTIAFIVKVRRITDNEAIPKISVKFTGRQVKKTSNLGAILFFYRIPHALGSLTLQATTEKTDRYLAGVANKTVTVLPRTQ